MMKSLVVGIAGIAATAWAGSVDSPGLSAVAVCMAATGFDAGLLQARVLGAQMFRAAAVTIAWRHWATCPSDGIRVLVSQNTPNFYHPQALAYAMPFEGHQIVIFRDRIANATEPGAAPFLLAHVLVHEVTHILQGVAHHSESGVMKATFEQRDMYDMRCHPLPFTDLDVELIRLGMKTRTAKAVEITPREPVSIRAGAALMQ